MASCASLSKFSNENIARQKKACRVCQNDRPLTAEHTESRPQRKSSDSDGIHPCRYRCGVPRIDDLNDLRYEARYRADGCQISDQESDVHESSRSPKFPLAVRRPALGRKPFLIEQGSDAPFLKPSRLISLSIKLRAAGYCWMVFRLFDSAQDRSDRSAKDIRHVTAWREHGYRSDLRNFSGSRPSVPAQ